MPHLLGSRSLVVLVVLAGAALGLPSASAVTAKTAAKKTTVHACAHARTGSLRLARKARACRKTERAVTWGIAGPRGAQGPQGDPGPAGPGRTALFSAQAGGYVGALGPSFAPVSGVGTVVANEAATQTLSPAADFTAAKLAVRASAAPGLGNSVTVTLRDDGADTALACTISGSATTCTNASTVSVAAGSALALKVSSTPALPATSLLVGFEGS